LLDVLFLLLEDLLVSEFLASQLFLLEDFESQVLLGAESQNVSLPVDSVEMV